MQPLCSVIADDEVDLLDRARHADQTAIATLYGRHREPALRLAEVLAGREGAEDLLADAFARIVARFHDAAGPTDNFRGYLFTTLRNRHRDLVRRGGRESPASDHPWLLDGLDARAEVPGTDEDFDHDRAAAALASLPPTWREAIVLLEIEEHGVTEVAARLGLTPAAVSSLGYRAREGLRTAYLDQRIHEHAPAEWSECRWVRDRLSRFVRATLCQTQVPRVERHAPRCPDCAPLLEALQRTNRQFRLLRLCGERPVRQLRVVADGAGAASYDVDAVSGTLVG